MLDVFLPIQRHAMLPPVPNAVVAPLQEPFVPGHLIVVALLRLVHVQQVVRVLVIYQDLRAVVLMVVAPVTVQPQVEQPVPMCAK